MLDAERHAVELASNAIGWVLKQGDLAAAPGLAAHATACRTQLDACRALLNPSLHQPKETP